MTVLSLDCFAFITQAGVSLYTEVIFQPKHHGTPDLQKNAVEGYEMQSRKKGPGHAESRQQKRLTYRQNLVGDYR